MSASDFQPLQGMSDLGFPEILLWQRLEAQARDVLSSYGFQEVRTPVLERTSVFVRSLGEGTDVVQKEMYTFEDRGGRSVSLRPEGTAGTIRHICAGGPDLQDARLFYFGPMFRCERPQAGRKRQFHQLGVEVVGPALAMADAECIALQTDLLKAWGLVDFRVEVHTRGLPEDAVAVRDGLIGALAPVRDRLCEDCRRRMDTHPLRILDCKQESCRALLDGVPPITSFMGEAARTYLDQVLRLLERSGIPARLNPRLVRGLDYYLHTIWEVTHTALGAQDALAGGGRYRISVGGREVEGVGFAIGIERVVAALVQRGLDPASLRVPPQVWLVALGDAAREECFLLAHALRSEGWRVGMDLAGRSMKAQMRAAHRAGAPLVVIRGETELQEGVAVIKSMADGRERRVPASGLAAALRA